MVYTAQAGIAVVTREGEKTLTIQNAQELKGRINAEKEAMRLAKQPRDEQEEEEVYQSHKHPPMTGANEMEMDEDQEKFISEDAYLELPSIDVEGLNDWERQHLGEQDSDSDNGL